MSYASVVHELRRVKRARRDDRRAAMICTTVADFLSSIHVPVRDEISLNAAHEVSRQVRFCRKVITRE